MRKRTPWARIYEAGLNGTGCRLSVEDVGALMMDHAITTRGSLDLEAIKEGRDPYEEEGANPHFGLRPSEPRGE